VVNSEWEVVGRNERNLKRTDCRRLRRVKNRTPGASAQPPLRRRQSPGRCASATGKDHFFSGAGASFSGQTTVNTSATPSPMDTSAKR